MMRLAAAVGFLATAFWGCAPYPALSPADPAPVATLDAPPPRARAERVIIVSIDGLRPDAIDAAGAETLQRLIERGAYCATARSIRPSVTLPSHTSMLSGLDPERHQVFWNSYRSGYLPHPTVFSVVAQCGGESAMLFSKDKFYFLANPKCVAFVYGPPPPDRAPPPEDYRDPDQQEMLLQRQRDAAMHPDERHTTTIWNVEPKNGEPMEFDAHPLHSQENAETAYGLITVMPSWGDASLRTVLFSGTLSPGTQAAAEFFSSAKRLADLRRLSQKEGYLGFPSAYQVVVRSNVFGTSALDVQYVTHRVIAK